MVIIAFIILVVFTGVLAVGLYYQPTAWKEIGFLFLFTSIPGFILLVIGRRQVLSIVHIDEEGIRLKCIMSNSLYFSWEKLVDIGIGKHNQGYGYQIYWIYFSTVPLDYKFINNMNKVKISETQFKVEYSKKFLDEVLKHVDKKRIKNLSFLKIGKV